MQWNLVSAYLFIYFLPLITSDLHHTISLMHQVLDFKADSTNMSY